MAIGYMILQARTFYMGMAAGSATAFSEWLAEGEQIRELYRRMIGL